MIDHAGAAVGCLPMLRNFLPRFFFFCFTGRASTLGWRRSWKLIAGTVLVSRTTGTGADNRIDDAGAAATGAGATGVGIGGGGGGGAAETRGGDVSRWIGGANWTSAITLRSSAPPEDFLSFAGSGRSSDPPLATPIDDRVRSARIAIDRTLMS